ncbi:TonB-dependent receptor [Elizabethkingia sp. HX QKY]|uniref:TonB-dependent receptor n=1 Tax=Elizabethkingia TaxID=308865 RepID=UPI002A23FDB2|nr:TonB-dependent receptor [Elizabethkingia sp. HX QKY]MDX8572235.1 TonB-dependent receptor [Elizabethkingia sp. HX QKY]
MIQKQILYIVVILFFSIFTVKAQELSGFVKDKSNNEPIQNADLTIIESGFHTKSQRDGSFKFQEIKEKGEVTLEIKYLNFKKETIKLNLSVTSKVDIFLTPVFNELEEVTIVGTPVSSNNRYNSTSASVVKQKDLQGAGTNLIDALSSQVPGVTQMTTGPAISKPLIRGLGSNRVITMSGGIKQQGQQWGDEHGIEIDQNQAGRIEVLRGAASLMYGSDAIGGVINILDPDTPVNGKITGEILSSYSTNNGLSNSSLMVTGNQNGFVWRTRGSFQNAHDFKTPLGYFQNSGYNTTTNNTMVGINKKWGYSHLNFSYFDNNIGFNEAESMDDIYGTSKSRTLNFPRQNIRHYKLALNNNFDFKGSSLKLDLGYQNNQRKEFEETTTPALFFDLNTYSLDAKYSIDEKNGWKPVFGISTSLEESANKGEEFLIPAYRRTSIGTFGYLKKTINNTTYSVGLRYDYIKNVGDQLITEEEEVFSGFKNSFGNVSGALGFTHIFNDKLNIKANAGSAFRAPNPAELGSNGIHRGTNRFQTGNSQLKAERSYQADVTLEYRQEVISGSIGIYNNYMNNYIYAMGVPGQQVEVTDEEGETRMYDLYKFGQINANFYGLEGEINIHPVSFLHFHNTFTYTHATNLESDRPIPFIPAGVIRNSVRFEPNIKKLNEFYISFGVDNYFAQNRIDSTFETPAKGYTLLNAGFGFEVPIGKSKLKIYSMINNIADKKYSDALNRLRPGRLSLQDTTLGVLNPGRNITFGVYIPFEIL